MKIASARMNKRNSNLQNSHTYACRLPVRCTSCEWVKWLMWVEAAKSQCKSCLLSSAAPASDIRSAGRSPGTMEVSRKNWAGRGQNRLMVNLIFLHKKHMPGVNLGPRMVLNLLLWHTLGLDHDEVFVIFS